jgi:hypothetical protein
VKQASGAARYAERVLAGVDDRGDSERVVIWVERGHDGMWAVGRAVNPQHRDTDAARSTDYVFSSYELDDALDHANEILEDDVRVLEDDGAAATRVPPFTRKEILPRLERWFIRDS